MEWLGDNAWLGILSLCMCVGSVLVLPFLVAMIPRDYFARAHAPASKWRVRHPALRLALWICANVLGALLLLVGIALLFLPGQGILTMLAGLVLMQFPGKRQLELALVRRRRVLSALNWLRRRANKEPLVVVPGRDQPFDSAPRA